VTWPAPYLCGGDGWALGRLLPLVLSRWLGGRDRQSGGTSNVPREPNLRHRLRSRSGTGLAHSAGLTLCRVMQCVTRFKSGARGSEVPFVLRARRCPVSRGRADDHPAPRAPGRGAESGMNRVSCWPLDASMGGGAACCVLGTTGAQRALLLAGLAAAVVDSCDSPVKAAGPILTRSRANHLNSLERRELPRPSAVLGGAGPRC